MSTSLYQRNRGTGDPTKVVAQYVWGARPGHRDELILRDRDTDGDGVLDERLYCLMDYFNPVAVVDTAGDVKERYAWSAFGLRSVMGPDWTPRAMSLFTWDFGFHGQFLDRETRCYDYGFRYFSPELGRWVSRDPIGEKGGKNIYGFVESRPVNGLDYLGLTSEGATDIRIGFLGLNPRQLFPGKQVDVDPGWVDGAVILNASADRVFESTGFDAALSYVVSKIDQDKNGGLSKSECQSYRVMVAAFSWGAWSALIFAEKLADKAESGATIDVRMGLVDPVRFGRIQGKASRPKGVSHLVNIYQRNGLGFNVLGVSGKVFVGESISGADIDHDLSSEMFTASNGDEVPLGHREIWWKYGQSIVDIAFLPPPE